jgi:hypothetical protein
MKYQSGGGDALPLACAGVISSTSQNIKIPWNPETTMTWINLRADGRPVLTWMAPATGMEKQY